MHFTIVNSSLLCMNAQECLEHCKRAFSTAMNVPLEDLKHEQYKLFRDCVKICRKKHSRKIKDINQFKGDCSNSCG